ncbi:MAG: NYN domain-containing protein, partial [Eubacteriales bacterium]
HLDRDSYPPQYSKNNKGSFAGNATKAYQVTPEEMQAIFERTYGKVRESGFEPVKKSPKRAEDEPLSPRAPVYEKPDYLLVDGYNIIHAWEELSVMANNDSMDAARQALMNRLSSFKGMDEREIILVFDAYRVQGEAQRITRFHNINVVYTREAETADEYIEKVSYEIGKRHRVTVATGDSVIQLIALGHGALRISPDMLLEEVERCEKQMKTVLDRNNSPVKGRIVFPEGYKPPE